MQFAGAGYIDVCWLYRRAFYDKRLAQEVSGDALGEVSTKHDVVARHLQPVHHKLVRNTVASASQEFNGYIFKIMGGQDKQGFPMKQGVLVPGRVRLLMKPGDSCFRGYGRRNGERRRKSVRGCIVSPDLSVLNLMIVKQGESRHQRKNYFAQSRLAGCNQLS